jgi:hypothetical protein
MGSGSVAHPGRRRVDDEAELARIGARPRARARQLARGRAIGIAARHPPSWIASSKARLEQCRAIADPAPAPASSARRPQGDNPRRESLDEAGPSAWSPCQPPSALRRMTLTAPRKCAPGRRGTQPIGIELVRHGDDDAVKFFASSHRGDGSRSALVT